MAVARDDQPDERTSGRPDVGRDFAIVDIAEARRWAARQLDGSPGFLKPLQGQLHHFASAWVVANPLTARGRPLNDTGGVQLSAPLLELTQALLTDAAASGLATVVVESEVESKSDPYDWAIEPEVCFFGESVIRYAELAESIEYSTLTLLNGATGYPLNAVLSAARPETLGLAPQADLTLQQQDRIVASADWLITSIWDAETLLVLGR